MKSGDLVMYIAKPGLDFSPFVGSVGVVFKIDEDYYGATQAFKRYKWERGKCINTMEADGIGPTARGKRDRVLVLWKGSNWEYVSSDEIEVISD